MDKREKFDTNNERVIALLKLELFQLERSQDQLTLVLGGLRGVAWLTPGISH